MTNSDGVMPAIVRQPSGKIELLDEVLLSILGIKHVSQNGILGIADNY